MAAAGDRTRQSGLRTHGRRCPCRETLGARPRPVPPRNERPGHFRVRGRAVQPREAGRRSRRRGQHGHRLRPPAPESRPERPRALGPERSAVRRYPASERGRKHVQQMPRMSRSCPCRHCLALYGDGLRARRASPLQPVEASCISQTRVSNCSVAQIAAHPHSAQAITAPSMPRGAVLGDPIARRGVKRHLFDRLARRSV